MKVFLLTVYYLGNIAISCLKGFRYELAECEKRWEYDECVYLNKRFHTQDVT